MPDQTPERPPLDPASLNRIYDAVSKNIERENNLIHQRISWAILLSAGILAAEGVIINYLQDHFAEDYKLHLAAQIAIIALTVVAIIFCALSWSGVLAAHWQTQSVKRAYKRRKNEFREQGYPRPFGKKTNHWLGSFNAFVFPFAMMVLWLLFLVAQFYQFNWLWSNEQKFKEEAVSKEAKLNQFVSEINKALNEVNTKLNDIKPAVGTKKKN